MAVILLLAMLFQESPNNRVAGFYPHPKPPAHLVQRQINAEFLVIEKHWFWTTSEPYRGAVRIEQARPKGGWWISANRVTDVNGKLSDIVELDSEWPQHILFVLMDGQMQIASFETDLDKPMIFKVQK